MKTQAARTRPQRVLTAPLLSSSVLAEQIALEEEAVEGGVLKYRRLAREAIDRGDGASLKPAERLLLHWYEPLVAMIEREQEECRAGEPGVGRATYGPILIHMKAEKLAVITMHEVVSAMMSEPDGVPMIRMSYAIGRAVFAEYNMMALRDADCEARNRRRERLTREGESPRTRLPEEREPWQELVHRFRNTTVSNVNWWAGKNLDTHAVERKASVQTGAALIHELVGCASAGDYMTEVFRPAFVRQMRRLPGGKQQPHLIMATECFDLIAEGHVARSLMRPRYLPMLVPPYSWSADADGGYVKIRTPFTSKPTAAQKAAIRNANLSNVYDCLDAVCGTPWRINAKNLEVVRHLWKSGGGLLSIPLTDNLPMPPHPPGFEPGLPPRERWASVDAEAKEAYKTEAARIIRENIPIQAARFEFLQKFGVAERFESQAPIYYPHQLDFRGRVYPIPAQLNHQGDDLCRGLLEFHEGKESGDEGDRWIMVQIANTYGYDKASYADRRKWVVDHLADVVGSASEPIKCEFWHKAKKPWQFLAACRALVDREAAAHLPVDQDGTCNGLQHYAAMALDSNGAAVVNMIPGDAPVSVYTNVAETVRGLVQIDADAGVREAGLILPHVCRDLVKQPTMTQVYGVTEIGVRQQIAGQLAGFGIDERDTFTVSRYLSGVVLRAIARVCPAASAVMGWIRACAKQIATAGHLVSWTTPLGFPVVQPYRRWSTERIDTLVGELVVQTQEESVPVDAKKHVDGSAPNFVHSVDACHMFQTARECRRRGITAAFVHDAYRTHAATRSAMATVLREQFVELHTPDLLTRLHAEWSAKHPSLMLPLPPERGTYRLESIMDSDYFFN